MIVLTNTTAQTLAPGDALVFDNVKLKYGCTECHRRNTPSVKMCRRGAYDVSFKGNVAAGTAATTVELSLSQGGDPLPETYMEATSTAAGDVNNISCYTIVDNNCCDYGRLTVVNSGDVPITVSANSALVVEKRCC